MPNEPLVSVIVPVYNAGRFVIDTVNSALAQTYQPLEIIAVNDGSTDDSRDALSGFGSRIVVIDQANSGVSVARNHAVKASSGKYLAFLDADDLWMPDKIEKQVAILEKYPTAVGTYCDHKVIDASGHALAPSAALGGPRCSGEILPNLLMYTMIVTPSLAMVRRDAFDQAGAFNETEPRCAAEDISLWLRLAMTGPFLYDLNTLACYRRHDSNSYNGPTTAFRYGNLAAVKHLESCIDATASPKLQRQIERAILRKSLDLAHQYSLEMQYAKAFEIYLGVFKQHPSLKLTIGLAKTAARMLGSTLKP